MCVRDTKSEREIHVCLHDVKNLVFVSGDCAR